MSTELDEPPLSNVTPLDEQHNFQHPPAVVSSCVVRQNLAGGTGVFANFFEEMAGSQNYEAKPCDPSSPVATEGTLFYPDCFSPDFFHEGDDFDVHKVDTFYVPFEEDDDLNILDQYKRFTERSHGAHTPFEPLSYGVFPLEHSTRSDAAIVPSPQPIDLSDYMHGELGSDMCIAYSRRCKPPKVLAKRFLLGETIGRGSYGKVKDAIDLVTLRRHAVKIISKFGVRKIPGGWCQALLEASVMLRLPPHRHIVSLAAVLRLDSPDRLCLVMEHCLGSVHDLQSAGVPSTSVSYDVNELDEEFTSDYRDNPPSSESKAKTAVGNPKEHTAAGHKTDRRLFGKYGKFRTQLPTISTDIKQETKGLVSAIKNRKVSNIEAGLRRKQPCAQQTQQQQFRRLSEAQAHAYFIQLIDGLHFLHQCGVIHRDIKPANLLLTPAPGCGLSPLYSVADFMDSTDTTEMEGNRGFLGRSLSEILEASRGWLMKLTDFGVSASLPTFSTTDEVSGGQTTPAVQPPEVAKGVQSVFVGSKLDVYSAGVSLYFMLTGRVPFSCNNVLQIFEAIAQGDYTIPGHVSANAAHLVRKMMCKDPKKRFTLEQIASHPWVVNDPPPPMSVEQLRSKMEVHSPAECANILSERGFACWLDPLEFLLRPAREFPAPHIDETGARIFTPIELGLVKTSSPAPSVQSTEQTGIAPFSALERLKVYHAFCDPEGLAQPHAIVPTFTLDQSPQRHFIESQLSNLGLSPSPYYAIPPSAMPVSKQRHYSAGFENVHNFEHESASFPRGYRQRGVTISLPTGSVSHRRINLRTPIPCEPPACPADLPVSPALVRLSSSQTGGTILADGSVGYGELASSHLAWSGEPYKESAVARHPRFRLGSNALTLGEFRPNQSVLTSDRRSTNSETELHTQVPPSDANTEPVLSTEDEKPHTRLHRRVTLWFSSLRRRLRNRSRRRETQLDAPCLDRSHTCESPLYRPTDPPSNMHDSVTSEPPSVEKRRSKNKRWLTIRRFSRHGKT